MSETLLTQKQEGFTLDIFQGLTETDAYRKNYSVGGMSIDAVYVEACRLRQNPKVSLRLAQLRKPREKAAIATVDERKERLTVFLREDIEGKYGINRQFNIQATAELNKMEKVYEEPPQGPAIVQTFIFVLPDGTRLFPNQLKALELPIGKEPSEPSEPDQGD